jgi:hypothetical protein
LWSFVDLWYDTAFEKSAFQKKKKIAAGCWKVCWKLHFRAQFLFLSFSCFHADPCVDSRGSPAFLKICTIELIDYLWSFFCPIPIEVTSPIEDSGEGWSTYTASEILW